MNILALGAIWFFCLLIWLKTNAFVEYMRQFNAEYISEYETIAADVPGYSYITFLLEHKNCFFTRLITCPVCLTVWFAMTAALLFTVSIGVLAAFLGLFFYLIVSRLLNEQP
jgi:hypothetical protein